MVRSLRIAQEGRQNKNLLGILVLGSLGLGALSVMLSLILVGLYFGLLKKEPPAMVQLQSGKAISTASMDSKERTPAVIKTFVQETMTGLMSATGKFRPQDGKDAVVDPGIQVATDKGQRRLPTLSYLMGFGLSEDFRGEFLKGVASQLGDDVFNGTTQTVLVVQDISQPEKVAEGQWKVAMVANLLTFNALDRIGKSQPFNKEIFVRAITPPTVQPYSSDLERQVSEVRVSGLEIYAIRNFDRPNL